MITDFCGNELQIGDYCAFSCMGNTFLRYGIITETKTNAKGRRSIAIEYNGPYNKATVLYRVSHNVIKIDKSIIAEKILVSK